MIQQTYRAMVIGLILIAHPAVASDVVGRGNLYIEVSKVTKMGEWDETGEYRKFALCNRAQPQAPCRPIGARVYRLSELSNLHDKLISFAIASGAVTLTGLGLAAVAVRISVAAAAEGARQAYLAVAGTGSALTLASGSDYTPWHLYQTADLIRDQVINDLEVTVDGNDQDMKELAWSMDQLLKKELR